MDELELTVDSLDAVAEPLRALYAEQDGKFRLKVKGVEDTGGLKSALEKERQAKRDLEKKVKRWESLGKSDEEIAELLAQQEKAATEKASKEGNFDAILKQHQDKFAKEKAALQAELDAVRASEREAIISTRLMSALTKAGATEEGIELLPDRLASRIKFEVVDGKRVVSILAADGVTPLAGSGADGLATFDDLAKEVSGKYPSLFKASGTTGGGMPPSKGAGGSGIKRRSDFKSEKDRALWVREHGLDAYKALPA